MLVLTSLPPRTVATVVSHWWLDNVVSYSGAGSSFGCDPPPFGWSSVHTGSRPYLIGIIGGVLQAGVSMAICSLPHAVALALAYTMCMY